MFTKQKRKDAELKHSVTDSDDPRTGRVAVLLVAGPVRMVNRSGGADAPDVKQ